MLVSSLRFSGLGLWAECIGVKGWFRVEGVYTVCAQWVRLLL